MPKDRARDTRRSVAKHQSILGSLGRAANWKKADVGGMDFAVKTDNKGAAEPTQILGEHPHAAFVPGKSTAVKFGNKDAVQTSYDSIIKGK